MKEQQFQQFAIVQGNTASDLTDKLNSKLLELKGKEPTVEAVCDNFFRMLNDGGFELCLKK